MNEAHDYICSYCEVLRKTNIGYVIDFTIQHKTLACIDEFNSFNPSASNEYRSFSHQWSIRILFKHSCIN